MITQDRPTIEGETTDNPLGLYEQPDKVWVTREGIRYGMMRIKPGVHVICAFTGRKLAYEFTQSVHPPHPYMVIEEVKFDEALDIARMKHKEFAHLMGVMVDLKEDQVVYIA